ncbi:hypothetical protein BT69DRAFT_1341998 [Atractiella rhizophila]|nr:hypothetical protein BT69DRAFT_1341998 [Atractiella rhizophila]
MFHQVVRKRWSPGRRLIPLFPTPSQIVSFVSCVQGRLQSEKRRFPFPLADNLDSKRPTFPFPMISNLTLLQKPLALLPLSFHLSQSQAYHARLHLHFLHTLPHLPKSTICIYSLSPALPPYASIHSLRLTASHSAVTVSKTSMASSTLPTVGCLFLNVNLLRHSSRFVPISNTATKIVGNDGRWGCTSARNREVLAIYHRRSNSGDGETKSAS